MNHAYIDNQAVSGARRGQFARLVRLGVMACVLAGAGASALAQNQDRGRRDDSVQMRERYQAQDQRAMEAQMREAQVREEQQRRAMEAQQEREVRRRDGRMTPDERRDLRRQINEAGVDLYPNARRR